MNKKKLKEELSAIFNNILNKTIDFPDNTLISLPSSTSLFTKKRLELIEQIKSKNPQSVQELAKITKRAKQAVTRDLKILERFGIIRLEKKGRTAIPIVERQIVILSIPYGSCVNSEKDDMFGNLL